MKLLFLGYILFIVILVGCGGHTQEHPKGTIAVAGAAIGTVGMPGIGTAVGAGVGLLTEREVNRQDGKSRIESIRDEVEKQKNIHLKLSAQASHHSSIMDHLANKFAPEIEKGRMTFSENESGLNVYLNETFFFAQGKTLSKKRGELFRSIFEKISSIPQVLLVIEESSDSRKNGTSPDLWSAAKFLHQNMPLSPRQILVKSNDKLLNISGKATTFPAMAYPVRIIFISPST